jgi:aldose 1-epimerase
MSDISTKRAKLLKSGRIVEGRMIAMWRVAMGLMLIGGSAAAAHTSVRQQNWGNGPDGSPIYLYTVSNGLIVSQFTNYGARVVAIKTPDKAVKMGDVVLGYDDSQQYLHDKKTHLGATVGRYANLIAAGNFVLEGHHYSISVNSGRNALHGGRVGFDQRMWQGRLTTSGVELTLISKDGDMGFPGNMRAEVSYTLNDDSLLIHYHASTDKPTIINLANHTYFNLNGNGDIFGHLVSLNADRYTPVDAKLIPTGVEASAIGTPMDFRKATPVGLHIGDPNEQLRLAGGYDHNFILNDGSGKLRVAARVYAPQSGRSLTVSTTQPGIQFYSGNFLDGTFTGRHGQQFVKHAALCLETQHFPDSPNHPGFPSTVLMPGAPFDSTTVWKVGAIQQAPAGW